MSKMQTRKSKPQLWDQILALLQQNLAERRNGKVFVETPGESGPDPKEIGELSKAEIRSLEPRLRIRVVNWLLERYLAEQGHVDLLKGRHPYTKNIRDLGPEDLPALIAAEWEEAKEHHEEHERERFVREARKDLDRLGVVGFTAMQR